MATIGVAVLLLVLIVFMYFMMTRKGGGCCGSGDPGVGGGSCAPDEDPNAPQRKCDEAASEEPPVDPVCGMTVEPDSALAIEYQGKRFLFCSEHCRKNFEKEPEKYQ